MKVEGVGIGSTNGIRVRRNWLGTRASGYGTDALVTKVEGNYNIVDNLLTFAEAPYGNTPLSTDTNPPDDRDWIGIATGSSFQGRTFLRSGITNSSNETYYEKNIVLDVLYVLQDFRKIGVARSLMNKVEEIAKDQKLDLIIKGVEKSNLLAQKLFKNYTVVNRTRYLKKHN